MSETKQNSQAYMNGYWSARADHRLAHKSEISTMGELPANGYPRFYAIGYRDGWSDAQQRRNRNGSFAV